MPAKIDEGTRGKIVQLRALDYDKQEIAQRLGVSRNTVSRHLQQVQREAENGDEDSVVLDAIAAGMVGAGMGYVVAKVIKSLSEDLPQQQYRRIDPDQMTFDERDL